MLNKKRKKEERKDPVSTAVLSAVDRSLGVRRGRVIKIIGKVGGLADANMVDPIHNMRCTTATGGHVVSHVG